MTIKRFIVENIGADKQRFGEALGYAIKCAESTSSKKVTLVINQKNMADIGVVGQFFGGQDIKRLCQGDAFEFKDVSIVLTIPGSLRPYDENGVVVPVHLTDKSMDKVDSIQKADAIINLPWERADGEKWMSTWAAVTLGAKTWNSTPLSIPPAVKAELDRLTNAVNLSTGIAHSSDKKCAEEALGRIAAMRSGVTPDDIKAYAVTHGWSPAHANELAQLAEKKLK